MMTFTKKKHYLLNTKQSGQSTNIQNTQPIKDMSSVSLDSLINYKE